MNTLEIKHILENHPDTRANFLGVFPIDELPKKRPDPPYGLVINYDPASQVGSHWVSIYADSDSTHFHDSLGFTPVKIEIPQFLDPVPFTATIKPIQHPRSDACGHHAVTFLVRRAQGISTEDYLSRFGADKRENDRVVKNFVATCHVAVPL